MIRAALLIAGVTVASTVQATETIRFTACPIYRDTDNGRKSGCWLADEGTSGVRYDITAAPTKPDWNHAVLVEGQVDQDAGSPCGGTVLDPVRVSVLEAPCTRFLIEAEGFKGRRFALPERNVRPLYEERTRPARPFAVGQFTVPFDFGSSFVIYQLGDYYLDAAINYALDVQPARIAITGHAQTTAAMVSGREIVEPASLATARAEKVKRALVMRGIDPATIIIAKPARTEQAPLVPAAFDGVITAQDRRVDIAITPR